MEKRPIPAPCPDAPFQQRGKIPHQCLWQGRQGQRADGIFYCPMFSLIPLCLFHPFISLAAEARWEKPRLIHWHRTQGVPWHSPRTFRGCTSGEKGSCSCLVLVPHTERVGSADRDGGKHPTWLLRAGNLCARVETLQRQH